MCFVFIWEQTASCATYSINWLVFVSIYLLSGLVTAVAVFRNPNTIPFSLTTDLLNVLFSWLLVHLSSTFFLVFVTEMKSVYSAVRTGSLNIAVCALSLVTWCTTSLTFNNFTLCPHCIYVFCIYLRTNSDLCHLQDKLIGFYNRDEKCSQRGTDWVFK